MLKAIRSLIPFLPLLTWIVFTPAFSKASALSDDLYSFQVLIGGDKITLPCAYERMIDDGWDYTGDEGELLRPEQRTVSSSWEKNGVLLSCEMVNTSWDVLPVKDCVLAAVELTSGAGTVTLPGGVTLGLTGAEEVINTYGAPSATYDGGDEFLYTYRLDYDQEAVFTFQAASGMLEAAALRNVVMAAPPAVTPPSGASAGSSYHAPANLGEDPLSLHVKYGSVLYALPAPVKSFVDNGWMPEAGGDSVVKAYGSEQLTLSLGGRRWTTWVFNNSDRASLTVDCLVTTIVSDAARGDVPLTLPGGVAPGMAETDMLAVYQGLDAQVSQTDTSRRYVLLGGGGEITIAVSLDTGLIRRVEVSSMP